MRTLCLGEALVDLVCEHPVGSLVEADAFVPRFGGATAHVAVTAARHGADVALAGGVGDDAWGHWLCERLEAEGVVLDHFIIGAAAHTPVTFVTLDGDGHPHATVYGDERPGAALARLGERLTAAVDASDALLLTSSTLVGEPEREATLAAHRRALDAGKPVVLDPDLRREQWRSTSAAVEVVGACVPGAFLVKTNADEACALTGERDVEAAAASLRAAGAQHVVVTLGADGALLRGGRLDRDVRGAPATPVDTTGAGSVVTGVLLAALARTGFYPAALAATLPEAVHAGARTTEHYGALG